MSFSNSIIHSSWDFPLQATRLSHIKSKIHLNLPWFCRKNLTPQCLGAQTVTLWLKSLEPTQGKVCHAQDVPLSASTGSRSTGHARHARSTLTLGRQKQKTSQYAIFAYFTSLTWKERKNQVSYPSKSYPLQYLRTISWLNMKNSLHLISERILSPHIRKLSQWSP
jgi:hypothetical protein